MQEEAEHEDKIAERQPLLTIGNINIEMREAGMWTQHAADGVRGGPFRGGRAGAGRVRGNGIERDEIGYFRGVESRLRSGITNNEWVSVLYYCYLLVSVRQNSIIIIFTPPSWRAWTLLWRSPARRSYPGRKTLAPVGSSHASEAQMPPLLAGIDGPARSSVIPPTHSYFGPAAVVFALIQPSVLIYPHEEVPRITYPGRSC